MASDESKETATEAQTSSPDESDTNTNAQNTNKQQQQQKQQQEKIEYNTRWIGYLCIIMFSAINFISISNVPSGMAGSMPFGILTFLIASLILIQDRCRKKTSGGFNYAKCKNGYMEGFVLVFFVVWWIVGVGYMTRPGGIAYTVSNIYFSSWLSVIACVYTLNEWSDSKDILSIAEITSVSFTLRYWWIHFVAAFVVFVSSCNLEVQLENMITDDFMGEKREARFAISMGLLSLIFSSSFILVHYDFITCIEEGGWIELLSTLLLIFMWIIALSIFTNDGGIAATSSGFDCVDKLIEDIPDITSIHNCTVIKNGIPEPCRLGRYTPGSNLYFACWMCMLSSVAIALKWKSAKALKFSQTKAKREQQQQQELDEAGADGYSDVDVDDDDDDNVTG